MKYLRSPIILALFACFFLIPSCLLAMEEYKTPTPEEAALLEERARAVLPLRRWEGEQIRELARTAQSLPDQLVAEALWLSAVAPANLDTNAMFSAALGSSSPAVRGVAASLLSAGISAESRRLLLNRLATEENPEIVAIIVRSMANLPQKRAVRSLMDIMNQPGANPVAVEQAAIELRRLTSANIGSNQSDWRDWWLEHESSYF